MFVSFDFFSLLQGVVQQGNLILNPNKGNPKLKDLYIRPSITQRRSPVSLLYGIAFTSNTSTCFFFPLKSWKD